MYIGTQSQEDISDTLSYNEFKDKYIETDENGITVDANENGNWLKVVDVDGDGVADYVLKTIYTMAGIEDIAKDGTITLSCDEVIFGNANHNVPQTPKYIVACAILSAGTPKARTNPQNHGASTSARRPSPSASDSHVTVPSTAKAKPRRAHSQPFSKRSRFMGG